MTTENTYIQYGAEASLFSGKTRSYLRYKGIPFEECKASSKVFKEILYPNTGVRVIPVVQTPQGEFIQDTTDIIDTLEQRFTQSSVYPNEPTVHLAALLLELFADEWLLLPAMHYRWYYKRQNLWFILKEFGANATPHWPKFAQAFSGAIPALYFGNMFGPVLGVSDNNRKQIEQWYESFLVQLNTHFDSHPFLLGNSPCIADFGFIGPLYAHLYRDPYPGKLMKTLAPNVVDWVERMMSLSPEHANRGFVDNVPETLNPIFKRMFSEQFPVLRETCERVATRISAHPQQKLPRFLGKYEFSIGGAREKRLINSYAQWMLQRSLNCLAEMPEQAKQSAHEWLLNVDGLDAMQINIATPIERRRNLLFPKV